MPSGLVASAVLNGDERSEASPPHQPDHPDSTRRPPTEATTAAIWQLNSAWQVPEVADRDGRPNLPGRSRGWSPADPVAQSGWRLPRGGRLWVRWRSLAGGIRGWLPVGSVAQSGWRRRGVVVCGFGWRSLAGGNGGWPSAGSVAQLAVAGVVAGGFGGAVWLVVAEGVAVCRFGGAVWLAAAEGGRLWVRWCSLVGRSRARPPADSAAELSRPCGTSRSSQTGRTSSKARATPAMRSQDPVLPAPGTEAPATRARPASRKARTEHQRPASRGSANPRSVSRSANPRTRANSASDRRRPGRGESQCEPESPARASTADPAATPARPPRDPGRMTGQADRRGGNPPIVGIIPTSG